MHDDDDMLDALAADLPPVQRPRRLRDAAVLVGLALIEVALYIGFRGARPDMPLAMGRMAFWWKVASLVGLAVIGVATTLTALDPARTPRRGLRVLAALGVAATLAGWALDAAAGNAHDLADRLDWRQGLDCLGAVIVLSLPPLIALTMVMRRGAATDLRGSATAAGVAAAAWGGAVFTVACPADDPLYVVVWFAAAIVVTAVAAQIVIPRLTRW